MSKRIIALTITGVVLMLIVSAGIWMYTSSHTTYKATASHFSVKETGDHPANRCQNESSVWIGVYDGKLYFSPRNPGYPSIDLDGHLCVFEDGDVRRILYLCEKGDTYPRYFMFFENRLYYGYRGLSLYDFQTGEALKSICENVTLPMYEANDSVYFPEHEWQNRTNLSQQMAAQIQNGIMTGMVPLPIDCGFRVGEDTYFVLPNNGWNSDGGPHAVYRLQADGELKLVEECGEANWTTAIIPVEDGLLVHNDEKGPVLLYIDDAGRVMTLFDTEGFRVKSAVTVIGTDVYLSVDRFENEVGFYQLAHFENDTVPGTYRISLRDLSTVKLSDAVYDGLFNFDDTCLYACYKRSIYCLNLDGTVQETLLKVK